MKVYGFNFITCGPSIDQDDSVAMSSTHSDMLFLTKQDVIDYIEDAFHMMSQIMKNKHAFRFGFVNDIPKDGVVAEILLNDGFIEWKIVEKEMR